MLIAFLLILHVVVLPRVYILEAGEVYTPVLQQLGFQSTVGLLDAFRF
jgi:hypothetical protein